LELNMNDRAGPSRNELVDLLSGRPGWRLEPRLTPGSTPLWCFVSGGKIEFSASRDGHSIHLYVLESDQEMVFKDASECMLWLRTNRPEALQEPVSRPSGKSRLQKVSSRLRKFGEWS
jgi:hypothetical protein